MAQLASAPRLGRGGRRFESCYPDQVYKLMNDVVAQYPQVVFEYKQDNGEVPTDMHYEEGVICVWNESYFIHVRVTLPLYDHNNGIGFGLWIKVSKEDAKKYIEALEDDSLYKGFSTTGTLANDWPGFENILGIGVTARTVSLNEKPYVTNVDEDRTRDPLFYIAIRMQRGDSKTLSMVQDLVSSYLSND